MLNKIKNIFIEGWLGKYDPLRMFLYSNLVRLGVVIIWYALLLFIKQVLGDNDIAQSNSVRIINLIAIEAWYLWFAVALWRCGSKEKAPKAWWFYKLMSLLAIIGLIVSPLIN